MCCALDNKINLLTCTVLASCRTGCLRARLGVAKIAPMSDEFETIEHDIIHVEDYFHNYKFSYIERATKQYFCERLREKNFADDKVGEILSRSKAQLVDVKKVSKDAGVMIKECSAKIFDLESEVGVKEDVLAGESRRVAQMESEIRSLEEKSHDVLKQNTLGKELREACEDLQVLIKEIEIKKQDIANIDTKHLRDEVAELKTQQEKLLIRERRWSKVIMENNIDDLYCWYTKGSELIEKIIGCRIKGYETTGNRMVVRFEVKKFDVEVLIEDGRFVDAKILGGIELSNFNRIKEYAVQTDDVRFLLFFFLLSTEK